MEKAPKEVVSEETIKEFVYNREVVCRLIMTKNEEDQKVMRFEPSISEIELEDKLYEMPTQYKLDMPKHAKSVFIAAKLLEVEIKNYITNAEIVTYVVNNGLKSSKNLKEDNQFIYDLAVERGLIKKMFPKLKKQSIDLSQRLDDISLML